LCRGAAAIIKLAHSRGWATRATYARGTTFDQYGTPTRVVDSLMVKLHWAQGGNARAVAVWTDGKFDLAYKWAPWLPAQRVKSTALRAWLRGEG
jgi:hypothetical protein